MIPPLQPTFEAALRDVRAGQARFRGAAAARLAEPPPGRRDEAVQGLLVLAEDSTGGVREAAFESLGLLGAAEGLEVLRAGFDDPHFGARQAAVLSFGRIAPEGQASEVASLLDDPRPEMRFSAVWTFASLGEEHAGRIQARLADDDPEVRMLAVQSLGDLGARESADAMAALLQDAFDEVRFAAASALASLGDSRGVSILRDGLARTDRAFPAAIGLGELEDRGSRDALLRLAKHRWRSPILRVAAAGALVRLGEPTGAEVIRKVVRGWRIEARQYAVELVGELGLTSLVPDLRRALQRSRPRERAVYETALERLSAKSPEAAAMLASLRSADHPG